MMRGRNSAAIKQAPRSVLSLSPLPNSADKQLKLLDREERKKERDHRQVGVNFYPSLTQEELKYS